MPSASATAFASYIMQRQMALRDGSVVIRSNVARVSALIGLKLTLPQSFSQTFQRILSRIGASNPAPSRIFANAVTRPDRWPSGSPSVNRFSS